MLKEIIQTITPAKLKNRVPKTLIIPTGIVSSYILRQLSLMLPGGAVANLKVVSMRDFVHEHAETLLPEQFSYISDDETASLLKEIVHGIDAEHYFNEVKNFPGLYMKLSETIEELRLNGWMNPPLASKKWEVMTLIIDLYEKKKEQNKQYDYADALKKLLHSDRTFSDTFVAEFDMKRDERMFFQQKGVNIIPFQSNGKTASEKFSGFITETRLQEAQMVINSALEDMRKGRNHIVIAMSDYDADYPLYESMLKEKGARALFSFKQSNPFLLSPQGELWKRYCDWVADDFSLIGLMKLLESPRFLRKEFSENTGLFFAALRKIQRTGHAVLSEKLITILSAGIDYGEEATEEGPDEKEVEVTEVVSKIVNSFIPLLKETGIDVFSGLVSHFKKHCHFADEDALLKKHFLKQYEEFILVFDLEIEEPELLLAEFNSRLATAYADRRVPSFALPVICSLRDAIYTRADKLYVTGLNEKGLPSQLWENPLLLDNEKSQLMMAQPDALYKTLPQLSEFADKVFSHTVASAGEVVFSAPVYDTGSGREFLLSRYFMEAIASFQGKESVTDKDAKEFLQKNSSSFRGFVHSDTTHAFSPYEKILAAAVHARGELTSESPGYIASIKEYREASFEMTDFNKFWGKPEKKLVTEVPAYTATMLSEWAKCPQKFYLKRILGLSVPAKEEKDELQWLNALGKGNLLHKLFEEFFKYKTLNNSKYDAVSLPDDNEAIKKILAELIETYREQYPVRSELYYKAEVNALQRIADTFIARESLINSQRLYAEYDFKVPANIKCDDGTEVALKGKIDRIDKNKIEYILYDYKTGKYKERKGTPFLNGELLQSGMYPLMLAATDEFKGEMKFAYYYTSEEDNFRKDEVDWDEKHRTAIKNFVSGAVREIREANFPVKEKPKVMHDCEYCDFMSVCLSGRELLGQKLKDSSQIAAWKKIREEK